MRLSMGDRAGRGVVGSLVWGLVLTFMIACAHNAWADASAPAAAGAPAPSAGPTPVPPITSPAVTGPLQMPAPNEINVPKYVPFLTGLPAPVASLLDFDVN